MLKKILLFLTITFLSVLFISCWDSESTDPIGATNTAPVWDSVSISDSCLVGDTLKIDLNGLASDADVDSLSFSILGNVTGVSIINDYLTVIAPVDSNFTATFSVIVSDTKAFDTLSVTITIYGEIITNAAPVWSDSVYNFNITKGVQFIVDLSTMASDSDSLDVLSFNLLSLSDIDTIANTMYQITAKDSTDSVFTATIEVTDGKLADTATLVFTVAEGNNAPVWTDTVYTYNAAYKSNFVIDLSKLSSDSDLSDALTYSIVSAGSSLDSITDSLYTLYVADTLTTPYAVKIAVSDGKDSDTATFQITLFSGNSVPYWNDSVFTYSVVKGESLNVDLASLSYDADSGTVLSYSKIGSSGNDTILGAIYTIHADSNTVSPYTISIVVSDTESSDTAKFNFIIKNPNTAPIFANSKPLSLYEIEEGDSLAISIEASDSDTSDTVIVGVDSMGDLPNSASATFVNGVFKWVSTAGDSGTYVVTFYATDGIDTIKKSTTIKVDEANIAPTITVADTFSNGTITIKENDTLKVNFKFNDLNESDVLLVESNVPAVNGLSFTKTTDSTGVLTFVTDYNTVIGQTSLVVDTVKVTVSDGEASAKYSLVINVNNVNRLPVFTDNTPSNLYTVTSGDTLEIPFAATDEDTEDTVKITVDTSTFKAGANITVSGNKIIWYTVFGDIGKDTISLIATDGEDNVVKNVEVVVNEDGTAPTISVTAASDTITITEIDSTGFVVSATPAVQGDVVTLSCATTLPASANFNAANGSFYFKGAYDMATLSNPDTVFAIKFTAIGSGAQAAMAEYTQFIKVTNINQVPVFNTTTTGQTVGIANDYSLTLSAIDNDGDNLTYSVLSGGLGSISGNKLTWHANMSTVDSGDVRTFNVKVTDGADSDTLTWNVTIVAHKWTYIDEVAGLISLSASDSNTYFVLTEGYITGYANGQSKQYHLQVDTTSLTNLSYKSLEQIGNKLIINYGFYPGNGIEITNVDANMNFSHEYRHSTGYGSRKVTYLREDYRRFIYQKSQAPMQPSPSSYILDSDFPDSTLSMSSLFVGAYDIAAARTGTTVFIATDDSSLVTKRFDNGIWTEIENVRNYKLIEPASDDGRYVYFVGAADNLIYKSEYGIYSNPQIGLIQNGPLGINSLTSVDQETLWALDEYGAVYFSAHSFENGKYNKENFNGEVIKQIVASEDRSTVFAVTDAGKIYRY